MTVCCVPDKSTLFTFEKLKCVLEKNQYMKKFIKKDGFVMLKNVLSGCYLNMRVWDEN